MHTHLHVKNQAKNTDKCIQFLKFSITQIK